MVINKDKISPLKEALERISDVYEQKIMELKKECDNKQLLMSKAFRIVNDIESMVHADFETLQSNVSSDRMLIEGSINLDEVGDYVYIKIYHNTRDDAMNMTISLWEAYKDEEDEYEDADQIGSTRIEIYTDHMLLESDFEIDDDDDITQHCDKLDQLLEYLDGLCDGD